jgi:uncharacterized protein YxjI
LRRILDALPLPAGVAAYLRGYADGSGGAERRVSSSGRLARDADALTRPAVVVLRPGAATVKLASSTAAGSDGRERGGTMGLLRNRGQQGIRYTMREKLFAIGDDFWIETDGGDRAFKVNGKALRVRDTLVLESPSGEELFTIQEKKLSIRDKMEVERQGQTVATIKKALVTPLRERYSIEVEGGPDLEAKGNIVDHEYEFERDGDKVAEVSKRWLRMRDTYGIEVMPDQDDALILACTVCIDQMGRG